MATNKKQRKKNKLKIYLLTTVVIFGIISLIFIDFGILKLFNLKSKKNKLHANINQLLQQQTTIQEEIHKLTYDTSYVEKIAREKFMMVKPGEKVFKVIESKQVN